MLFLIFNNELLKIGTKNGFKLNKTISTSHNVIGAYLNDAFRLGVKIILTIFVSY